MEGEKDVIGGLAYLFGMTYDVDDPLQEGHPQQMLLE